MLISPATFNLPVIKAACGLDEPSIIDCMVSASVEIVHVAWIYGTETFFDNLSEMSMDFYRPIR